MTADSAQTAPIEWAKAGEQLPKRRYGPIDGDALLRYAAVSGDDNPLHIDPAIARRAGLEERPIHGMLMMGHFEPMIRAWRPDVELIGLSAKFLRPVLAGHAFELSGRVIRVTGGESPSMILRLMVHAVSGDLALVGEAVLRPLYEAGV